MSIKLKHSGGNSVSLNPPTSAPTSSEVAFKLPNADGSANQLLKTDGSGNLGFVAQGVAGITEFDYWYMSSSTGGGVNADITSGLLRNNQAAAPSQIGTGMTESSGIFTFPSTGKWLVIGNWWIEVNGSDAAIVDTRVTTNNSSYSNAAQAVSGIGTNLQANQAGSFAFINVTDTSQVKVKFRTVSMGSGSYVYGHVASNGITSSMIFLRLGDT
jgi:hypothetical protein